MIGHFGNIYCVITKVSAPDVKNEFFITTNQYVIWDGNNMYF